MKKRAVLLKCYYVLMMLVLSGCSREQPNQDVIQIDSRNQITVQPQITDKEGDPVVPQKIKLERVSAEDFYHDEAQKEEAKRIKAVPTADILSSIEWENGSFSICRVNKKVENGVNFYDIIAVYTENGMYHQVATLEEENVYSDIRLIKYENALKYDGYKVMIPVGANAQDVFYFTMDKKSLYPAVVFKVSALGTYEFDLDADGIHEIIAMQSGTSIYDEDSRGYFYYSTEKYMQEYGLYFNIDKGCYYIKNQNSQIIYSYSLLRNSELILDSNEKEEDNTETE